MIILVLIISFLLRIVNINQSLWLDEGINATFAISYGYTKLIFNYSLGDFHPPLYHLVLRTTILLFGTSEVALRLPSVVFGVATVFITYLIGKKLYDSKTGLIAALLIATGPLHIYYSQEARMYMMAAFFASLSLYFFISIIKLDKLINWTGFIVSTTLMLYTDYVPYFIIPVYFLYLFVSRKKITKNTIKSFVPAFLLILMFIAPWFIIFPSQLKVGLTSATHSALWANVVGSSSFKDLFLTFVKFTIGRISSDNNFLYAVLFLPVGLYVSMLFLISSLRMSAHRVVLIYFLFLPIILTFLFSFYIPVFSYFRLIFVLPAFYLLLASAINNLNWTLPTRTMLILMLAINLLASSIYFLNPQFYRENWKEATRFVVSSSNATTLVLFDSNFTMPPFDYYNKGLVEAKGALESFEPNPAKVVENVSNYTSGKNKVFLFQYLSSITDPQGLAFQSLVDLGFVNTKTKDFKGVGFIYEFTR